MGFSAEEPNTDKPTHINGAEVTVIGEPNEKGNCEVACKDGSQYVWNCNTGAVYPAGHPAVK